MDIHVVEDERDLADSIVSLLRIKGRRIKLICVNILIVFIMLCTVFLTVVLFMRSRISRDSADFVRDAAADKVDVNAPFAPGADSGIPKNSSHR